MLFFSRSGPFEVSLWKAASYAISTRLSFLTIRQQEKLLFRQDREDYCVRCGGIVAQFDVQTGFGWMRNAQSGVDEAYGYWRRVGELLV
jgi:hypothetical protein